jgi:ribosome-binding protein aMBF1 (putative translation factor)
MNYSEYLKNVGQRIKTARKKAGYTVRSLSPLIEIHYSSISAIECGKSSPNLLTLKKIADILNINIKELV